MHCRDFRNTGMCQLAVSNRGKSAGKGGRQGTDNAKYRAWGCPGHREIVNAGQAVQGSVSQNLRVFSPWRAPISLARLKDTGILRT